MRILSKLRRFAILLVFVGFLTRHKSGAEKVLLVPPSYGDSHWMTLARLSRAMVDRGHVVTVIVSEDIVGKRGAEWPDFKFEAFQDQGIRAALQALQDQAYSEAGELSFVKLREAFASASEELKQYCAMLLGDSKLVERLRTSRYSVVISDPFFPCGAILSAYLDCRVPHIALLRGDPFFLDVKATGVPVPPSYVPSLLTDFTDDMTFLQRLQNVVLSTVVPVMARQVVNGIYNELVRKYIGEEETIQSVTSRTDLWLYRTDDVLDFPRPSMPNIVQVGGLNVRAAVPLTEVS
ncbi:UDP-glucuronosyltransferase 1A1-like [Branchiostoma floridae]|uniref:UDP-glucuronosyltransferase 1A1-like n=1 Tax=Branchiostoma floridae TaxID=7739 RepID=A0A9J7L7K8_BRAFL|nr:UDP-glucuronosyltransferase 1A1-like [Branchiostoma floridae]